jgi:HD superfamily phosphohydrolase
MHHEEITKVFIKNFRNEFGEIIDFALEIFNNKYEKKFLFQLISSQLDVDRLDYLSRDSYFTGVAEGVIGYDRIIKMLDVIDNEVVVEEKGITSVEKYLVSRYLMYKQVYLHKTSLMAEKVLNSLIRRVKFLMSEGQKISMTENLYELLINSSYGYDNDKIIHYFSLTDDYDIWGLIKNCVKENDNILKILCESLLNRKLFKVYLHPQKSNLDLAQIKADVIKNLNDFDKSFLIFQGKETINCYSKSDLEVKFLSKEGQVENLSKFCPESFVLNKTEDVYFDIYPN